MSLESITGRLAETYPQLDPNTIQHSAEITNDRRTNSDLRNQWFWTADFPMYAMEGEAVLYLAPREHNLAFKNLPEAVKQIRQNGNYKPSQEDVASVVESAKSGQTLRVKLSDLRLEEDNDEWCHFNIDTENYDSLNASERALAERAYGQGDDFAKNMKMLNKAGIKTTRFYVLNPNYVEENVEDGAISRLSGAASAAVLASLL